MKPLKHIVYVVSSIEKSLAFEWVAVRLKDHYRLTFVLLNDRKTPMEDFLVVNKIDVVRIKFRGKMDYPGVFWKLCRHFARTRPHAVHAHLLDAQVVALAASAFGFVRKRIYTRHNSNFHHVYHRKGVVYDRISNRLATRIISISQATDKTLRVIEKVDEKKIVRIPHGLDLPFFQNRDGERIRTVRSKWNIPATFPCIGVVARHIEWKGIQFIIPAFKRLLRDYPDAILVLANAHGPYHQTIANLLSEIPTHNYVMIPFEEDVASLYHLFDLYVHVPVDEMCEAFGQTYVEALAAGVPSVFTKSGIGAEFIEHKKNAWVVDYKSSEAIYFGMKSLLVDERLGRRLADNGRKSVEEFGIDAMVKKLQQLYDE